VRYYVLLHFDEDDRVIAVRTIAAKNDAQACRIARMTQLAHATAAAGYQLWRKGRRVAAAFPSRGLWEHAVPVRMLFAGS